VDVAPDKTTYRQTFRKHRILLSLPVILAVLMAGYIGFTKKPTYQSTAALWVDTPPPLPSSVGASTTVLPTAPATGMQSELTELLTTKDFADSVARESALGAYLRQVGSGPVGTRASLALVGNVTTSVSGPQVLAITYTGPTSAVASSTLTAVVKQLQHDSNGLSSTHDKASLAYDRQQLEVAEQALSATQHEVSQYTSEHPHSAGALDPNLSALVTAEDNAQTQYSQAKTTLSQDEGQRNGGWMVEVVDPASAPVSLASGKKKLVEVIFAGLLGGALISFLGAVALTPARKEPWEDEFARGEALDPRLAPRTPAPDGLVGAEGATGRSLRFFGERQLIFRHDHADDA
jgi:uncharacterized protein involved in exopolysaccharide biosynthesis